MNFGFRISPSSSVNLDTVDLTLYKRLLEIEPDAGICMSCGSCSGTCTAAPYSGMSVRKVIHCLQRGDEAKVKKMLSNCMLCGKCSMVCPRGINTRHLILTICRICDED